MATLYTIGHSTRTLAELVAALAASDVELLVDIRSIRRSRTNPQFNETKLARALPARGIGYRAMPGLGGRRPRSKTTPPERNAGWRVAAFHNYADYAETADFAAAFAELATLAETNRCSIMCAEAVWWRCHRRIVADYAILAGLRVEHIFTPTKRERATRTPFAKLDRKTRTLRYPALDAAR